MNDKIIINTISKIHFTIVSALFFIFLTFSILFILLQNGISIQKFSLPNVNIGKLYIKWNEKLCISVKEIQIIKDSSTKQIKIDFTEADKLFKALSLFDNWFEKIEIENMQFNDINASFRYLDGEDGFLRVASKDFSLRSSLFFESGFFNARVEELIDHKRKIYADGNIIYKLNANSELYSSFNINIDEDVKLKIYSIANDKKLLYKIDSKNQIKDIEHIIDIVNLSKEVKYWAFDAIKMSNLQLKSAYGWVEYENFKKSLDNLYIRADVHDLEYTYNPALEPVISKVTELEFKNSTLYIRPRQAYQYGFYLNKSWLKIDFAKKEELLTIQLLFSANVNKDILYLLNTYKIKLPILQNKGIVDTNLKIEVGPKNIGVKAKGSFYTKKSNFRYLGLDIDIFDAHVFLNNYDVVIKKMHSKYKDMLDANVDINFDAHKKEGKIKLDVLDVNFKDLGLKFQKSKKPLKISYTISNNHDIIDVARSKWRYKGKTVELDNMKIPFNLDKLTAKIPTTFVEVDALTTAFVYGTFSLKPVVAKLDVDLLSLEYSDIKMQQPSASLKIIYDKKLKIKTKEDITFSANGLRYIIKDSKIEIDDKNFNIIDTSLNIDNLASTQINTTFSFAEEKGNIILKDLKFKNKDFGDIFNSKKDIRLNISSNKTKTKISSEKFYMSFTLKEESWKLSCNSIANLAKNSKLLQDYNISNGIFSIGKDKNKKNIQFTSSIIYPYEVLVLDNEPIKEYKIKGEIEKKTKDIYFKINNVIDVNISKNIEIKAKDIGININEVFRYSNNLKTDIKDDTKQGKDIFFNAKNSYIYISKDRHAISDDMEFQYFNNAINAKLKYEKASAVFELKDKKFYLFGENFNDKFMENLFALSKLKDGVLSFSISGSTEKFAGLLHVKDTTIMDYKILNNMLAFINTIPSLVTFSLPGYSKMGLEVEDAYMKFNYENNTINVENIYLNSKEMDIVGEGSANFKLDTVDLNLNLKSDLGSGFSKIPLVGFILLDGDTVSTSMNISGKLSDPDVKSLVAKDIIVAPFNIIKRVITLPFHLFGSDKEDDK